MGRRFRFVKSTVPIFFFALLGSGPVLGQIAAPIADTAPARLRQALAVYQSIAVKGGWPTLGDGPTLRAGDVDERLPVLAQRLKIEGDLVDDPQELRMMGPELIQALRRYQARHGLAADGVLGPATLDSLDVPVATRIQQIDANLRRWQGAVQTPASGLFVRVNLAAAELEAFQDGVLMLRMRTIVGKTRTPTPQMTRTIRRIILNPAWNIPVKIAAYEILPRLRRDPAYLSDNEIIIVGRPEDPFGVHVNWAGVPAGRMFTLRQLPGEHNALGTIKFDMPNPDDIYLHDTPNHGLFSRAKRALSHGCVRLERPNDLALLILNALSPEAWSETQLQQQIASGETQILPLSRPVPVTLAYFTAFADPDGTVQFRDDLYNLDGPWLRPLTKTQSESDKDKQIEDCQLCN